MSKAGTPVDAAPPAPAAAPDEHVPFDFDDLVVGNSKPPPAPTPAAAPTETEDHEDEPVATRKPRLPYEGRSYTYRSFTFRPADYKFEAGCLTVVLSYLLASVLGAKQNKAHATAWFASNNPVLQDELAGVGFGAKPFVEDGGDEFLTYATGRRGVSSIWVKIRSKSRHDLFTTIYHTVRGIMDYSYVSGEDRIASLVSSVALEQRLTALNLIDYRLQARRAPRDPRSQVLLRRRRPHCPSPAS